MGPLGGTVRTTWPSPHATCALWTAHAMYAHDMLGPLAIIQHKSKVLPPQECARAHDRACSVCAHMHPTNSPHWEVLVIRALHLWLGHALAVAAATVVGCLHLTHRAGDVADGAGVQQALNLLHPLRAGCAALLALPVDHRLDARARSHAAVGVGLAILAAAGEAMVRVLRVVMGEGGGDVAVLRPNITLTGVLLPLAWSLAVHMLLLFNTSHHFSPASTPSIPPPHQKQNKPVLHTVAPE